MQTLTFTQKLLRQRSLFSSLIPLLALFLGLGASQKVSAQIAYSSSNITIDASVTSSPATSTTYIGKGTVLPKLDNADLGNGAQFDQSAGNSTLNISAASARIAAFSGESVIASSVFYRVYPFGATAANQPAYSQITLSTSNIAANPVTYSASGLTIDLLHQPAVLGGGTYTVELYYTSDDNTGGSAIDKSNGSTYKASFRVIAPLVTPPGGTTTWISTLSTEWTLASNWSNGVPTRFADAIIPEKNSTNTNTSSPALLNTDPNLYEVRSITLNGTFNSTRALLRIGQTANGFTTGATLNVYGDLNTYSGGILAPQTGANGVANPALNSTIVLKGGDQAVRGLLAIADIRIEGTGVKNVVNVIAASNTFTFAPGVSALVRTVTETRDQSTGLPVFSYNSDKIVHVTLKTSGTLFGETNTAYIDGVTLSDRNLVAGIKQTFGNVGVDITSNRDINGSPIEITRTVGDPLSGPTAATVPFTGGTAGAKPVKRQYGVSGDVNNAPTVSEVVFHYLDTVDELNGNPEPNLIIFRTVNGGIPYGLVGGVVDVAANTVTQVNVRSINTITLGDRDRPLPVTLTTFNAKRAGADALVTWETASELNNKGFNVQVSTDGKEFRTLGFVASASPNSVRATTYSYTDTEKNKAGLRYYRLMQVDTDGKTATFAPRAVSFEGNVSSEGTTAFAYPNPFTSEVSLSLPSKTEGQGQVTITDMTGRTVSQRQITVGAGNNDVKLTSLNDLKTGIYLMHVTLPSGETKNLKVVKQ